MARTTVTLTPDLVRAYNQMRRKEPALSRAEALIRMARKGALEVHIEDINAIMEQVERSLLQLNNDSNSTEVTPEWDLLLASQLNTLSLLRHFVANQLGESGRHLIEKAKQDVARGRK